MNGISKLKIENEFSFICFRYCVAKNKNKKIKIRLLFENQKFTLIV